MQKSAISRWASQSIEENLTQHAWKRMTARGLSPNAVEVVLDYGRINHIRGAIIYAIGRKEVEYFKKKRGINLVPYEGLQVVCTQDERIITVYRNRDFRGLRPTRRYQN